MFRVGISVYMLLSVNVHCLVKHGLLPCKTWSFVLSNMTFCFSRYPLNRIRAVFFVRQQVLFYFAKRVFLSIKQFCLADFN